MHDFWDVLFPQLLLVKIPPENGEALPRETLKKRGRPLKPRLYWVNCPSVWNGLKEKAQSLNDILKAEMTLGSAH